MTSASRRPGSAGGPEYEEHDDDRRAHESRSGRIAPDGQRVVDQSAEIDEEHREIERNAEGMMAASRAEGADVPSVRFWRSPRTQVGPMLALLAGVFTLAMRTWPIATPQGRGSVGLAWETIAIIAGLLYVAGFLLADRHWKRARLVLLCAAPLHLLVSALAAATVDAQDVAPMVPTMLFDAVPATLAIIAALLIRPAPGARQA